MTTPHSPTRVRGESVREESDGNTTKKTSIRLKNMHGTRGGSRVHDTVSVRCGSL
jgi:hypothetical protein